MLSARNRNAINKSAAFSRNCFSHSAIRKGDSSSLLLGPNPGKPASNLDDTIKEKNELNSAGTGSAPVVPLPDSISSTLAQNYDFTDLSISEKRAAKRKRQKEKKASQDGSIQAMSNSTEDCGEEQQAEGENKCEGKVDTQGRDGESDSAICDWKLLGLTRDEGGMATSSTNLSESSEANGFENCADGDLPNTDKRSSMTDSSGVETSSDADGDQHTCSIDSRETNFLRDQSSDIQNGAYIVHKDEGCDIHLLGEREDWDQNENFTVITRRRKTNKPQALDEINNSKSDLLQNISSSTSFQLKHNVNAHDGEMRTSCNVSSTVTHTESSESLENSLSHHSSPTVETASKSCISRQKSDASFDVDTNVRSSNCSSVASEKLSRDNSSVDMDDVSSWAGLSDFISDEILITMPLLETSEEDWTVVKAGRRSKNAAQIINDQPNGPATADVKHCLSANVGKCSGSVAQHTYTNGYDSSKSGIKSQNYRCNKSEVSNSKTFNRYRRDNISANRHLGPPRRTLPHSDMGRNLETDCIGSSSRSTTSSEKELLNEHQASTCNRDIVQKDNHGKLIRSCSSPLSDYNGNVTSHNRLSAKPAMKAAVSFDGKRSQSEINSAHKSSAYAMPAASGETFRNNGSFDLSTAQTYLHTEYMAVLAERKRNPHLVVFYHSDSD